MAYINGSNLRIFPASNRSAVDQSNNNWLTEFNLSSIVNQLVAGTNIKGFVITEGVAPSGILPKGARADNEIIVKEGVNQSLEFNIAGYYFQVANIDDLVKILNGTKSAATPTSYLTFTKRSIDSESDSDYSKGDIVYSATAYLSTDAQYKVLLGNDEGGAIQEDSSEITLDLFYKRGENYYIPASSRINFSGIQTFKHKDTRTQFTVKGAQITNYVIDDGEI